MTREQFHALPVRAPQAPKDQSRAKACPFLIPATLRDGVRETGSAIECNLVFVDIDDSGHAETVLLGDPVNALAPFAFAIYHTASSTPANPRLRVIVAANRIPAARYIEAVELVASMLGLPEVTRESRVVVQPMFRPVVFQNDPETNHPLVVAHLEGRELEEADLPSSAPAGAQPDGFLDLVQSARPRVEGVTFEVAKEALSHLDPDCPRRVWIEVAAALKHQFGEDGLRLWRDWSAKGKKFGGDKEVEVQWKSLKPAPKGRAPVTFRTVLKLAADAGWNPAPVVKANFEDVRKWLEQADATDLLRQGVERIADVPLLSPIEQGALMNLLQARLSQQGAKVNRSDLTKQLRSVEASRRGKGGDDQQVAESDLPAWARGIAYVTEGNLFYRHATGQRWTVEAANNAFARHLMTGSQETEADARPLILPQHFLLNVCRVPVVDGFLYDPTHPQDVFVSYDRKRYLNTYRPTYPEPDYERKVEAEDLLRMHCSLLFNSKQEGDMVLDWLAYCVQNPGEKILWAVLLQGAEGCGKSAFFEILRACLGDSNVKQVQAHSVIHSQWTEWAADCQAVAIPEIRVIGENRHLVMNKLKTLIADKTIAIDQRNRDTRTVPNFANYFLTTNHKDALALTENDRRYYVLFSKLQSKAQVRQVLATGHYGRLFDLIKQSPGAYRAALLDRVISPSFNPIVAPDSGYKADMLEAAATPLQRAVEEVFENRVNPQLRPDLVNFKLLRDVLEIEASGLGRFSDQALSAVLRDMGLQKIGRLCIKEGERATIWGVTGYTPESAVSVLQARIEAEELL
jgi:hypothetical protein